MLVRRRWLHTMSRTPTKQRGIYLAQLNYGDAQFGAAGWERLLPRAVREMKRRVWCGISAALESEGRMAHRSCDRFKQGGRRCAKLWPVA